MLNNDVVDAAADSIFRNVFNASNVVGRAQSFLGYLFWY